MSGYFSWSISTALATLSERVPLSVPKLEDESIAMTGSIPKRRTVLALIRAICTRSSAVGEGFTAVSAKNMGPRLVVTILIAAS